MNDENNSPKTREEYENNVIRLPLIDVVGGAFLLYFPFSRGYFGETIQKNSLLYSFLLVIPVGYIFHIFFGVKTELRKYIEQ